MADKELNRRSFLQLAGVGVGFTALPVSCSPELGKSTKNHNGSSRDVMSEVCSYVSKSGAADLPPEVVEKAKHHILDTLTAMVTGAEFKVGGLAVDFARSQGGGGGGPGGRLARRDFRDQCRFGQRYHGPCRRDR